MYLQGIEKDEDDGEEAEEEEEMWILGQPMHLIGYCGVITSLFCKCSPTMVAIALMNS